MSNFDYCPGCHKNWTAAYDEIGTNKCQDCNLIHRYCGIYIYKVFDDTFEVWWDVKDCWLWLNKNGQQRGIVTYQKLDTRLPFNITLERLTKLLVLL